MKPTFLDGVVYATREGLKKAAQAYVNAAPLYTPLSDTMPYAILAHHPHYEEKVGTGLRHIELRLTEFKTRGFYAVRENGTEIDFSWRVALGFQRSAPSLQRAAREAVRGQIAAVAAGGMHVHHEGRTFQQLLDGWLAERGGEAPRLIHGALHDYFTDPNDVMSWQKYHRQHATLRLVSVAEHKQLHGIPVVGKGK